MDEAEYHQAKTCLHWAIDAKFTFNCLFIGKFRRYIYRAVQLCKYSPNSRCHLSSCILAVLAMFLANSCPISSLWNKWNVPPFCTHYQNNSTLSQVFSVTNCSVFWQLHCRIDVIFLILKNSSKFGQQYLPMINYPRNFSQLEMEKYFEWMNNNNILIEYISVLFHTSNTFEIVICLENISAHYCTSDIIILIWTSDHNCWKNNPR